MYVVRASRRTIIAIELAIPKPMDGAVTCRSFVIAMAEVIARADGCAGIDDGTNWDTPPIPAFTKTIRR